MSKTVKVTYNADTLQTEIIVDGQPFDTSRINGREIEDWAYPFMMRKVRWNGFYDEMVDALGGEKVFNLIFDGPEAERNELKEAWEDAPVTIISEENAGNTVVIRYDESNLTTDITVNGESFDTSRINGREIEDWVYPFMMRKVKWNGFYEEMVVALGGQREFNLIFEGSEAGLNELKEALVDAPVTIISEEESGNMVAIEYNENNLTTNITVNGQPFDTSRINGREIEDWVYPFMMRKVKWDGIFAELAKVIGSEEYTIQFWGSNAAMRKLMEECPEKVQIVKSKKRHSSAQEAKKGTTDAQALYEQGEQFRKNKEYTKALECYRKSAECYRKSADLGNADAQNGLGFCYFYGVGVEQDDAEAVKWYTKAAEQGNADAQNSLGDCYFYARGVEQNYKEAVKWYTKAAEQGNADAQLILNLYTMGDLGEDYTEAVKWFTEAAEQGLAIAQNSLGNCYLFGVGVKQDDTEAVKWYTKAAKQGLAIAQNSLGFCYYCGIGVEQDRTEAVKWYTRAAEQGDADAQIHLGWCYYDGDGVEQDNTEAVKWFTEAAEQGLATAQNSLGDCYLLGS